MGKKLNKDNCIISAELKKSEISELLNIMEKHKSKKEILKGDEK